MFPNQKDYQDGDFHNICSSINVFQNSYVPHQQDADDLFVGQTQPLVQHPNNHLMIQGHQCYETSLPLNNKNIEEKTSCDDDQKKIMRRDNERQRRQHMAILHSSLRSHLPLRLIKGKRSLSDHINVAAEYIQQMKTKIEELRVNRNKLKYGDLFNSIRAKNDTSPKLGCESSTSNLHYLTLQPYLGGGVEIVLSISNLLPLSRVLSVLVQQGIDVSNCTTTNVNGRLILTIQSTQVEDDSCIDMSELEQKLNVVLNSEITLY